MEKVKEPKKWELSESKVIYARINESKFNAFRKLLDKKGMTVKEWVHLKIEEEINAGKQNGRNQQTRAR